MRQFDNLSLAARSFASPPWRAWTESEIARALREAAHLPPGRVFSLVLRIPDFLSPMFDEDDGDWIWRGPEKSARFCGRGLVGAEMDVACWRSLRREWAVLGDGGPPPSARLIAPPFGGAVRLYLPKVLLRSHRGEKWLYLNGRRDSSKVETMAAEWMGLLEPSRPPVSPPPGGRCRALRPDFASWRTRVENAVEDIAAGRFSKIVLARQLVVTARAPFDADRLLRRMAETAPTGRRFKIPFQDGAVVADSPELLAEKRGNLVVSHALAGTARRHDDPAEDRRAAASMLASKKERREHEIVARFIAGRLGEICHDVSRAPAPMIMRLRGLQHLWTPVLGRLLPEFDLFDMIERLHPTPAVLGFPREAARAWLERIEQPRDGLYTGLAGWADLDGDGEAAVVLRSAFLRGREARLWAGAGIMAESRAEDEWSETRLKMENLLGLIEESA